MELKTFLKTIVVIGLYALLVTPFIVDNSLFFPYITGKAFYFRIIVEIIFFAWIPLMILDQQYRPKKSWIIFTLATFLISILISNIFGFNPQNSFWSNFERMEGYITFIHLGALFLVASSFFNKKEDWIKFFNTSIVLSLMMVFSAIIQVLENGLNFRVDTTLGNSTYVGVYMLMNAFLSLFLLSQSRVNKWKISFYLGSFVLQSAVVFQTGTRGSILGLIGGLLLSLILILIFAKGYQKTKKYIGLALLLVILFISSLFIFKDSSFVQNFQGFQRITNISITEGTAQARLVNWSIAWEGIKERPLLGWGQENYLYVFDKHYKPEMFGQEAWFDRTHNIIFDWLIMGGFVGLLLYLSIQVATVLLIWLKTELNVFGKSLLTGLLAAYFIHNFFVFDNLSSYIIFFLILSFVHGLAGKSVVKFNQVFGQKVVYIVLSVSVVLMPVFVYSLNSEPRYVAKNLIEAMRVFKTNEAGQLVYNHPNGIDDNMNIFTDLLERNSLGQSEIINQVNSVMSNLLVASAPREDIEKYLNFVSSKTDDFLNENPESVRVRFFLTATYLNVGQYDLAERYIREAIDMSPNRQLFRFLLARIQIARGDTDLGLQTARDAFELAPDIYASWENYLDIVSRVDGELVNQEIQKALDDGEVETVKRFLDSLLQRYPNKFESYISSAALYFELGQVEKSLEIIERAENKFPDMVPQLNDIKEQINSGNVRGPAN